MNVHASLLLFAEDFDAVATTLPLATDLPAAPPPPPSYGPEELDAACAQARAEGHAQGLADAAAADAARVADAVARIAEHMREAGEGAARATEEAATVFGRLLLAGMLAGYPLLGKRHGKDAVRWLIQKSMQGILQEPSVIFHVHPSMVETVRKELAGLSNAERALMTIEPSETMPPGDARISWPNGAAVRDTVAVRREIEAVLRPLGLLPDPEPSSAAPDRSESDLCEPDCADALSR